MSSNYDSIIATFEHITHVRGLLTRIIRVLLDRGLEHDVTKLWPPERGIFDEFTPKLATSTYGSPQYKQFLEEMKPALDHHYRCNRHHPEHFTEGIRGMNLVDLIEMLCDWEAATRRHIDGNIERSIEINQARFNYSDELKQILLNTLSLFEGDL